MKAITFESAQDFANRYANDKHKLVDISVREEKGKKYIVLHFRNDVDVGRHPMATHNETISSEVYMPMENLFEILKFASKVIAQAADIAQ